MIGEDSLPVTSYWKDVVRRFCKNKIAVIGPVSYTHLDVYKRQKPSSWNLLSEISRRLPPSFKAMKSSLERSDNVIRFFSASLESLRHASSSSSSISFTALLKNTSGSVLRMQISQLIDSLRSRIRKKTSPWLARNFRIRSGIRKEADNTFKRICCLD